MKRTLSVMLLIAVFACSKSPSPSPDPPPPPAPAPEPAKTTVAGFTPTSGKPGDVVTITGTGFGSDPAKIMVSFNGGQTVASSASETELKATVPQSAKSGTLTVTVTGRNPATSSTVFTVLEPDYVVKTIGISLIRAALDDNGNLLMAEAVGGGNRVILKAGNDYKMEFTTASGYEPVSNTLGILYSAQNTLIDNGKNLDTTFPTIKLKGFDKSKTGYNQLNLVLCTDTKVKDGSGYSFGNFIILHDSRFGVKRDNAFFKKLLTTNISISHCEIAATGSPYIIRDIVTHSSVVVIDSADNPMHLEAIDGVAGWTICKFDMDTRGRIEVGGPLQIELVNLDKGDITPFKDQEGYYNYVTFTNGRSGKFGLVNIPEPKDSLTNVFIRVSGFNRAVTGFHQLRIFINADRPEELPTISLYQKVKRIITKDLLIKSYKFKDAGSIQLVTQ